ncbi:MAG: peptidyl-prolyl cis-trans isomerase [Bacteroidota bacterium]
MPPVRPALLLAVIAALAACGPEEAATASGEVAARVGEAVLTEAEVADALGATLAGLDSAFAREQVIEQWVQRELLVQEARAQGLDDDPAVRRRIADSERATLEAAALESLFDANVQEPDEEALALYYDENREDLALREPYVRLRHLRVSAPRRAEEARAALEQALTSSFPDSLFALVAQEYADDPPGTLALSNEYIAEGRLEALDEALGARVAALPAGAQVVVVPSDQVFHVVQVVDRVPAGTVPPLALVRDELAERLAIQARRDLESQFLSQLRVQAQADGRLDIR